MTETQLVPALVPEPGALELVPPRRARQYGVVPLRRVGARLLVATSDPLDLVSIGDLEFMTGLSIEPIGASAASIALAIDRYYPGAGPPPGNGSARHEVVRPSGAPSRTRARPPDADEGEIPAMRLQRMVFDSAIRSGASDVHIDPGERWTRIRFRVDGSIADRFDLPRWLHSRLVARVKVLARLDISEKRRPQDGLFVDPESGIEGRVSTLPTEKGECAVVRLFRDRKSPPSLASLGAPPDVRDRLKAMCNRPQGMLLVSGPTGSGKTTTLYALIDELRRRELNILTIEDPVEYRLDGIRQVHVDVRSGLTFESALRATLRQDPDVILVGEIRDRETAGVAFEAALTGHLVLSTLHANDAIAVIGRLLELGLDRGTIAEALIGSVAQRLLRLNCRGCIRPDVPDRLFLERLALEDAEAALGRSIGCPRCDFSGVAGRQPFFEVVELEPRIRAFLRNNDLDGIRERALANGQSPILDQVLGEVRRGRITAEEAYHACYFGEAS